MRPGGRVVQYRASAPVRQGAARPRGERRLRARRTSPLRLATGRAARCGRRRTRVLAVLTVLPANVWLLSRMNVKNHLNMPPPAGRRVRRGEQRRPTISFFVDIIRPLYCIGRRGARSVHGNSRTASRRPPNASGRRACRRLGPPPLPQRPQTVEEQRLGLRPARMRPRAITFHEQLQLVDRPGRVGGTGPGSPWRRRSQRRRAASWR